MTNKIVIDFQNVTKKYRDAYILRNVNFHLMKGEILGIVGDNGSGKSTIMKLISELNSPSKGIIKKKYKNKEMGFLIEDPAFYPEIDGFSNIMYYSLQMKITDFKYMNYLFSIFKMNEYIYRKYNTYSLGMKKKLAIVLSLVNKPQVIVLDEPFSGLDATSIDVVSRTLLKLNRDSKLSILVSSHQLKEISFICNRFIFIDSGELVGQISIDEWQSTKEKLIKYRFTSLTTLEKVYSTLKDEIDNGEIKVLIDKENYVIRVYGKKVKLKKGLFDSVAINEEVDLNDYYAFLKER